MKTVSIDRLKEVLCVSDSGRLMWKRGGIGHKADMTAGCISGDGYYVVTVDYVRLQAHRVVFALANDRWPSGVIDHVNGVRTDNRPCNLRDATHAENARNSCAPSSNKSGVKGVCWNERRQKWQAQVKVHGITKNLGRFASIDAAEKAAIDARQKYHGEFACNA